MRVATSGSVFSHLRFRPSTCPVFSDVSITWAGGQSMRHVPIFGPTKGSVLRLGAVFAARCDFWLCGTGAMEGRFCVSTKVVVSCRGVVDLGSSNMEFISGARGCDSVNCMGFEFGNGAEVTVVLDKGGGDEVGVGFMDGEGVGR
nr:hypothetical protein CFP56_76340 [Quercus suber]